MFINTGNGFVVPKAGSVSIDTIWTNLGYKNKSGKSDTIIFTVCGVTAAGWLSNTPVYAIDTEIIAPHNHAILPGTSLDSTFGIGFTPKTPINIPASAMKGWHFCVHATVIGSKLDTLGITYYSTLTKCSGDNFCDSTTSMGPINGGANSHSNSFVTGLYWYNSKEFKGNGSQETFPLTSGHPGLWVNTGGEQFYNFTPHGCSGFIWYPYVQDIGMFLSIQYENITGINNITASGLSVNQNYPNPFNKTTQITYNLVNSSDVVFTVCDITGRTMVNNVYTSVEPGQHIINLNANTFAPGIYFYTFKVNGNEVTKKMVITE